MPSEKHQLRLRITLIDPPAGVDFALQEKGGALHGLTRSTGRDIHFDFVVEVSRDAAGRPRFLGPMTHGAPDERFVYFNSGTLAGQAESCWTRRGKVQLMTMTWGFIEKALRSPSARLETRIAGTAGDGGPACASVKPPAKWTLSSAAT
jgi:hypothetical protein